MRLCAMASRPRKRTEHPAPFPRRERRGLCSMAAVRLKRRMNTPLKHLIPLCREIIPSFRVSVYILLRVVWRRQSRFGRETALKRRISQETTMKIFSMRDGGRGLQRSARVFSGSCAALTRPWNMVAAGSLFANPRLFIHGSACDGYPPPK